MLYALSVSTDASSFFAHSSRRRRQAARSSRHLLALALALLALLLAGPASAQTADPRALADPSPPVIVVPEAPAPAPDPGAPALRATLGLLTGLGMMAVPTVGGYLIGDAAKSSCTSPICLSAVFGTLLGGAVGVTLYPLGVALGAHAAGGRGHFGWTYLGGLIGTAVGGGIIAAGAAIAETMQAGDRLFVTVPATIVGSAIFLAAPIIAYEMSDHHARSSEPTAPALSWMPTLSIDPHGATAGIAGTF